LVGAWCLLNLFSNSSKSFSMTVWRITKQLHCHCERNEVERGNLSFGSRRRASRRKDCFVVPPRNDKGPPALHITNQAN